MARFRPSLKSTLDRLIAVLNCSGFRRFISFEFSVLFSPRQFFPLQCEYVPTISPHSGLARTFVDMRQLSLYQFPGEKEILLPPLSNLEVIGEPYLKSFERKDKTKVQLLIVPLRVNMNVKSKTMEELVATRKTVLLSAIKDM